MHKGQYRCLADCNIPFTIIQFSLPCVVYSVVLTDTHIKTWLTFYVSMNILLFLYNIDDVSTMSVGQNNTDV